MKRFLIIGDRERYGRMEDFVVLWIGEASDQEQALKQMKEISGREPDDVYKVIEIAEEKEITSYSGF